MQINVAKGKPVAALLPWAAEYPGGDVFCSAFWPPFDWEMQFDAVVDRFGCVALQAHHNEPMIVGPNVAADDLDAIRRGWDKNGPRVFKRLRLEFIAPRLWTPPFSDGGLTSDDPVLRRKALDICKLSMDILAQQPGSYLLFWLAREGKWTVGGGGKGGDRQKRLVEAMNTLMAYKPGMLIGIEPKPEDPPMRATIATAADVLALAAELDDPSRLNVLVEIAHVILAGLDPADTIGNLCRLGKLIGIHANDQARPMIDQDHPFGSINPLQGLEILLQLRRYNWFDGNHYIGHDVKTPNCVAEARRHAGTEASIAMMAALWAVAEKVDLDALDKADQVARNQMLFEYLIGRR